MIPGGPATSSRPPQHAMTPAKAASPWKLPVVLQPHQNLLANYLLGSLLAGPGFPILALIRYFKYRTLRYELDEEGITMRWGILFRREVSLTYARIQDIHLSSHVVERWLGLARILIQTASGSAQAEITIEGVQDFEAMRDLLYSKMRGARDTKADAQVKPAALVSGESEALAAALREVAAEVRALRQELGTPAVTPEKTNG
ncbi:PH domain-containing protein [Myxococcus sp. MISCRS1]|uniref:PH domain-containing protein n=1 Tax=Myxococcus TaxID=32 RepID=UPI001CBD39B9|nr:MULTISPECIES: PH domain-containing protein [unclassified Myxococcus]MBZ4395579.1 PH domain-containing protein [Myxococcus sp. AS-1-15]MBZ4412043.1 PH domain-containing protein [Myxococcus sp. XM-1-1-1]MCY0999065.1 PH domain-containing protein [Myxococcus sp. MISCRS1]BDT30928.1 PH domain-containing protein [Myxococcus sp. MH1]